jgi:hypothetical protein
MLLTMFIQEFVVIVHRLELGFYQLQDLGVIILWGVVGILNYVIEHFIWNSD